MSYKEWKPLGQFNSGGCAWVDCNQCPLAISSDICLSNYAAKRYSTPNMTPDQVQNYARGWEYMICQGEIYFRNLRLGRLEHKAERHKL